MTEEKRCHSGPDPESIMSSLGLTRGSSSNKAFHSAGYPMGMTGEVGRSMVEMLGVLAVMGMLTFTGVKMYNAAMNKHHANTLIEQAQRRAVSAAGQINLFGKAPTLAEFSNNNTFTSGTFGEVTQEGLYQQFGIQVSNVPKAVCQNILNAIGESTSLRRLASLSQPRTAMSSCDETNAFLMVYNDDLKGADGDATYNCDSDTDCSACGTCNTITHLCENDCEVPTNV